MIKRDHTTPPGIARRAVLGRVAAAIGLGAAANVAAIVGTRAAPLLGDIADARAMLARTEQAIDVLRTCVVCEGWHGNGLNEEAASRTLQYLRRIAAGAPEDDQEWEAACAFFYDHGQSLDWIVMGNPGGMICGAAARSPRAAALIDDPIFAAIEAHRSMWARLGEVVTAQSRLFEMLPEEQRQSSITTWETKIVETDDPRWIASERLVSQTSDAVNESDDAILDTAPTTLAGVAAVLKYAADHVRQGNGWGGGYEDDEPLSGWVRKHGITWETVLHMNLAKALTTIAASDAAPAVRS
jgi:hypothetical protein